MSRRVVATVLALTAALSFVGGTAQVAARSTDRVAVLAGPEHCC